MQRAGLRQRGTVCLTGPFHVSSAPGTRTAWEGRGIKPQVRLDDLFFVAEVKVRRDISGYFGIVTFAQGNRERTGSAWRAPISLEYPCSVWKSRAFRFWR